VGEEEWGMLGFVTLVHVWVYFCCCSGGAYVRDCRGLQLCTVGTEACQQVVSV
jgi:hypothetical protein